MEKTSFLDSKCFFVYLQDLSLSRQHQRREEDSFDRMLFWCCDHWPEAQQEQQEQQRAPPLVMRVSPLTPPGRGMGEHRPHRLFEQ